MWRLACLLFLAHSAAMLVDELWFHRKRGLPRWERWGHPADTLTVLVCYAVALLLPPTRGNLAVYLGAAAFSTVFVTKDEWIHARRCGGGEMWLHAFLFVLHPVLLALMGLQAYRIGPAGAPAAAASASADDGRIFFHAFLQTQGLLISAFLLWQILYWNGPWAKAEFSPK
jgi:hypothetical protein